MPGNGTHIKVTSDGPVRVNKNGKELPLNPKQVAFIKPKQTPDSGLRMPSAERVRQKNSHLPEHAGPPDGGPPGQNDG